MKRFKGEIVTLAVLKIVEGILIILSAYFLVKLINFRTEEILFEVLAIYSARFLISNFATKKIFQWSSKIQTEIREKLHEEILRREIPNGEILTLVFDTVQTAEEFFLKVAPNIFSILILLPMFLICAIFTDEITAAILFVTLPIAPFLLYLIGKVTAEKNNRAWAELQKLNGEFKEILSAIIALKIFGRTDVAAIQLKKTSEKSSVAILDVLKFAFVSSFALELITTLSIALVAVTLGLRLVAGSVEFNVALFLLIIAPEFFLPIRKLGVAFHVVISAKSSFERIKKFLSHEEKVSDRIEKLKVPPEIVIENVSYTYPRKKNPAISGINLKISAGKITAITGESGCGKSTLLKLLAGLILPTEGEIFFSDLPISKMQRESLFEKISYSPQSPHLFDATLAENFSMFIQLDTKNLQKCLNALDLKLNLSDVQKLSRGQLQRLGIIRALLKNSSLILLDEPTAGLDEISEQKVLILLKKFSSRKTIVIATHKQAVINFADEIISLQSG